jgi:hypothetical protein
LGHERRSGCRQPNVAIAPAITWNRIIATAEPSQPRAVTSAYN